MFRTLKHFVYSNWGFRLTESIIIEIRGPGHHERSEFAGRVVKSITGTGKSVAVEADLRPRLAADISAMLEVGAQEVLLYAKGMVAKVTSAPEMTTRSDLEHLHDKSIDVIIRLVPSDGRVRAVLQEGKYEGDFSYIKDALGKDKIDFEN